MMKPTEGNPYTTIRDTTTRFHQGLRLAAEQWITKQSRFKPQPCLVEDFRGIASSAVASQRMFHLLPPLARRVGGTSNPSEVKRGHYP